MTSPKGSTLRERQQEGRAGRGVGGAGCPGLDKSPTSLLCAKVSPPGNSIPPLWLLSAAIASDTSALSQHCPCAALSRARSHHQAGLPPFFEDPFSTHKLGFLPGVGCRCCCLFSAQGCTHPAISTADAEIRFLFAENL